MEPLDRTKRRKIRVRKLFMDYRLLYLGSVFCFPYSRPPQHVAEEQTASLAAVARRRGDEKRREETRGVEPWSYRWNLVDRSHLLVKVTASQPLPKRHRCEAVSMSLPHNRPLSLQLLQSITLIHFFSPLPVLVVFPGPFSFFSLAKAPC